MEPWDYSVQVVIPHIDTPEPLREAVRLWSLQTVKPYICIVDTGSDYGHWDALFELEEKYRNVEVHFLRGRSYFHASEPVSTAMDFAAARCQQQFQFQTHSDVFPVAQNLLEHWMSHCDFRNPVVGYEISSRDHCSGRVADVWRGMVGHTATMLHMPTIDKLGLQWKLLLGHQWYDMDGTTDTEVPFNLRLRELEVSPVILGHDTNRERYTDEWLDHCRSFASSLLYDPKYHNQAKEWMDDCLKQARVRAAQWSMKLRNQESTDD